MICVYALTFRTVHHCKPLEGNGSNTMRNCSGVLSSMYCIRIPVSCVFFSSRNLRTLLGDDAPPHLPPPRQCPHVAALCFPVYAAVCSWFYDASCFEGSKSPKADCSTAENATIAAYGAGWFSDFKEMLASRNIAAFITSCIAHEERGTSGCTGDTVFSFFFFLNYFFPPFSFSFSLAVRLSFSRAVLSCRFLLLLFFFWLTT